MSYKEYFWWPVFRYGVICQLVDGDLSYDKALSIADSLEQDFQDIEKNIFIDPTQFGFTDIDFIDRECRKDKREGRLLHYPDAAVTFSGTRATSGVVFTICRRPRHSKLWLRLSYECDKDKDSLPGRFDVEGLKHFYKISNEVCDLSSIKWLKEYDKVVFQQTGKHVERIHTVIIRTAIADLGTAAKQIEARAFSMQGIFSNLEEYLELPGLLNLTFGEDVSSLQQYEKLSKNTEWISMSVRYKSKNLLGVYSKQHQEGRTILAGFVHAETEKVDEKKELARTFSREFVEDISPSI